MRQSTSHLRVEVLARKRDLVDRATRVRQYRRALEIAEVQEGKAQARVDEAQQTLEKARVGDGD